MIDIVIASSPYIAYIAPAAGPALLKGHLQQQGFTAKVWDLNVEFRNWVNDHNINSELIGYWVSLGKSKLSQPTQKLYRALLEKASTYLVDANARWIGLSVFSLDSRQFVADLLPHIKKINSHSRVVVGGFGLNKPYLSTIESYIDAYILGEGELALIELLKNNFDYPGINSAGVQIMDIDQIGFPDYSDYNLDNYENWYEGPIIQVTGSRGCVRNCTFCNVRDIWEKFRYRSGHLVAQEIIKNHEKTGVTHFYFTDSLINGNVRELMNMMRSLTEYKQRTESKITWGGQWITRSQRGLPKDYYKLIKSSGGLNITMGVETGSDQVRAHMKKNFTNADLDAEMEQLSKHQIRCGFLILVGYPTETEEDFNDTLRMLKRYTKYVADGTIIGVTVGKGFFPLPDIPITTHMDIIDIVDSSKPYKWKSKVSNANYLENIRRRLIIEKVLNKLQWPSSDMVRELTPLVHMSSILFNDPKDRELLEIKNLQVDPELYYDYQTSHECDIELTIEGTCAYDYPVVDIEINKQRYENICLEGEKTFRYKTSPQTRNLIKISLVNKKLNDTIVNEAGDILADKSVKIKELVINGARLGSEYLEINSSFRSTTGERYYPNGLYQNGTWAFYFKNPVYPYFINKQNYFYDSTEGKKTVEKLSLLFNQYLHQQS